MIERSIYVQMTEYDDILGLGESQEAFNDQGDAFDVFVNGSQLSMSV
jgi:hypothetical protein